jgi:hypothetical protein
MKLTNYDYNLGAYDNLKNNMLSDRLAKNRWGNKFKKLFNRHNESNYGEFPAYSFRAGMMECSGENGTVEQQIEEYEADKVELIELNEKTTLPLNLVCHPDNDWMDFYIESIGYKETEESEELIVVESENIKLILSDYVDDKNLLANETYEVIIEVAISDVLLYIDEEIAALHAYDRNIERANEDLELINHLGLCETLASEISRPHKVRSIYFRFKKNISPTMLKDENGFVTGYDPSYKWWEEEQFKEINKEYKGFKEHCTVVLGELDDTGGVGYSASYISVNVSIFTLSGYKLYWFVKVFLDIEVYAKKSLLKSFISALVFVVSIYLTAISGNPAWMKIVTILVAIAGFSGALSPELQLIVAIVMFAYGVVNIDFSSMSGMQMFSWAIRNIEMLMQMNSLYEQIQTKREQSEKVVHEEQELAMEYIYTTAYNQYDSLYNSTYDYSPNYK